MNSTRDKSEITAGEDGGGLDPRGGGEAAGADQAGGKAQV